MTEDVRKFRDCGIVNKYIVTESHCVIAKAATLLISVVCVAKKVYKYQKKWTMENVLRSTRIKWKNGTDKHNILLLFLFGVVLFTAWHFVLAKVLSFDNKLMSIGIKITKN